MEIAGALIAAPRTPRLDGSSFFVDKTRGIPILL